ncbi:MAG: D-glycerate dehydrogenase [Candidatus Sungbacteria bacterium RIFCSPHIGHO2_02_FULL_47_11]|uniref:D-glycerate dehydrogenase n=1 Tax=Candidatus Sungbacteria bacterium RIFCSPHIGHO2_02_FULL_47_11 TaxID=1802270 RepID=A0A1G2KH02_9BACT|nr:MAG: D-glycerate dehydrogenase [Candidatus Sungbacteria bacterium RIFCSPHIGHO2_02_FULL_47_11]
MPKIFITRAIPDKGVKLLEEKGHKVVVSPHDRVLKKEEFIEFLKKDKYDAVLCDLTDKVDAEILDAAKASGIKIFANYAVGFDNIDVKAAQERGILVTNTPGVLTDTVAEHTFALMLAISHRIAEADRFTRAGKYKGWEPMLLLGNDLSKKTVGVVGLGRIGSRVAFHAVKGFEAWVIYHDVTRNEDFEKEFGAEYKETLEELLREADFVSIHVPLLPATKHLINAERFKLMKPTAYLVNTSRGPIVDEKALVEALRQKTIRGAALDVFENEPALTPGLAELENVILTPHIASATEETRQAMGELAAKNIIEALEGRMPPNLVKS